MLYLIIFILLLGLSYYYDYKKETRGFNFWFFGVLLIFILLAGFRFRVGGDTSMYMRAFENVNPIYYLSDSDFVKSRFAPGFVVLTSLVKTFTDEFAYLQFIHAIIVNTIFFYFIRKNTKKVFFALLLFFCYLYTLLVFEQMRESIAVAIFLLAWPAFKKGEWLKWYFASLCAFLFHVSAFMMFILPIICVPWIRELFVFGKRTAIVCLFIFFIAIFVQTTFFQYIELIAVTEAMLDRVQNYSSMNRSELFNFNRLIGMIIQFILYPVMALYFLNINYKKEKAAAEEIDNFKKNQMMVLMSVYISIMTLFIGIMSRYNNYFFIFAILAMSDWIYTNIYLLKKRVRMVYLYWILLFVPMLGFNFYNAYYTAVNKGGNLRGYMLYYPYNSIFDKEKNPDREKTILYLRRKN